MSFCRINALHFKFRRSWGSLLVTNRKDIITLEHSRKAYTYSCSHSIMKAGKRGQWFMVRITKLDAYFLKMMFL